MQCLLWARVHSQAENGGYGTVLSLRPWAGVQKVAFSFDESSLSSPGEKAICGPLAPLGITLVDTLTAALKGMHFAPSPLFQPWEPRAANNPLHLSLDIAATVFPTCAPSRETFGRLGMAYIGGGISAVLHTFHFGAPRPVHL